MIGRLLASRGAIGVVMVISLATAPISGQTPAAGSEKKTQSSSKTWRLPRTVDGQPDLQGVWRFATVTPLERPAELAGKAVLTAEEAEAFAKAAVRRNNADPVEGEVETRVVPYNDFWWDRGTKVVGTRRTSLIVDPPDGKLPALTASGKQNVKDAEARRNRPAHGPEDRSLQERCIVGFNAGPPIVPAGYNQNVQLFQGDGYVVILNEMIHNARIVPLNGRPHVSPRIRQLSGDSRGRWEGETLIVETTNFRAMSDWPRVPGGVSEQFHLTERFRRIDRDTLLYEFTLNDPQTYTRPWSAEIPMTRINEPMFEYACHEGNYGMDGILVGARADDKAAAAAATKGSK